MRWSISQSTRSNCGPPERDAKRRSERFEIRLRDRDQEGSNYIDNLLIMLLSNLYIYIHTDTDRIEAWEPTASIETKFYNIPISNQWIRYQILQSNRTNYSRNPLLPHPTLIHSLSPSRRSRGSSSTASTFQDDSANGSTPHPCPVLP